MFFHYFYGLHSWIFNLLEFNERNIETKGPSKSRNQIREAKHFFLQPARLYQLRDFYL